MEPAFARVLELFEQGRLLAAFEAGRTLGPITSWPGTEGRVLAGRLAGELGARRIGDALFLRAIRADRGCALAGYRYTSTLLSRHGAFAALRSLRGWELSSLADPRLAADWHGLAAQIYGRLRDFDTAEAHLARAFDLVPYEASRWIERSVLFELEDEYAQALAAAQRGLDMSPVSPTAIGRNASLLRLLDRMPAALQLLRAKLHDVESPPLALQLAYLEHETGDYASALATLEQAERLAPIFDKELRECLVQRRCEAWLGRGDLERALQQARLSALPQYQAFVERIESGEHGSGRAQLPGAFVRPHHMTRSPATLTALRRYWSKSAEPMEIIAQLRLRAEYIDYLEAQVHAAKSDAMFQLRLAQALLIDVREHARAVKLLTRVLRAMPFSAEAFATLADLEWRRGACGWATQLYRLASTLQPSDEAAARVYLRAACQVREQEQALEYLRARVRRLGRLSSAPVITLIRCLHELDRTHEAMEELDGALSRDAEDPALALFAVGALAAHTDCDRTWPLRAQAEGRSRRIGWSRPAVSVQRCAAA